MVCKKCSGCLAIAASDAHHLGIGISSGKLNLRYNRHILFHKTAYHIAIWRYPRAFDNFISTQNTVICMLSFLPLYTCFVKHSLITRCNHPHVAYKNVHAFYRCQNSRTCTAFACTEDNKIFLTLIIHICLNVFSMLRMLLPPVLCL